MDFTFSDEQTADGGRGARAARRVCTPAVLREAYEGRDARASGRALGALAELGLPGMLAPEPAGGLGLDDVDFVLLAEEAGRAALPEPLVEHAAVAAPLLAELAARSTRAQRCSRARRRARACRGRSAARPVRRWPRHGRAGCLRAGTMHVVARRRRHGWSSSPRIDRAAARCIASTSDRSDAGTRLATRCGGPRRSRPRFDRGASSRRGAVPRPRRAHDRDRRRVRDRARSQFGQPIGSFQAIKHQLASVQVKLEFARPVVYAAAARLADAEARRADGRASHAKLAAGDGRGRSRRARRSRSHGAMGYTWEVDLHFCMKRAWALAGAWGDRMFPCAPRAVRAVRGALAAGPGYTFSAPTEA